MAYSLIAEVLKQGSSLAGLANDDPTYYNAWKTSYN